MFTSKADEFIHILQYEMIVFTAKRYGLAGASVHIKTVGFGFSKVVQSVKLWGIPEKLPIVIEIVEQSVEVEKFLAAVFSGSKNYLMAA